jgi:hypothetical protein
MLLALSLMGCSHKSEPPRYYDQGLRVPQPYDPGKVANAPSHTLPVQDPGIDVWAARFSIEPRLEYVPLSSGFAAPKDILTTEDLSGTASTLKQASSATPEYHQELLELVQAAETLDAAHLELVVEAAYYPETLRAHMEKVANGLVRKTDALSQLQHQAILKNLKRARQLGEWSNRIVALGIAQATDLEAASGLAMLGRLVVQESDAEETTAAFAAYRDRFAELEPTQLRKLFETALLKKALSFAADIAIEWFSSEHTARELVELLIAFPPGDALDSVITRTATDLRDATAEDLRTLAHALRADAAITEAVPMMIETLPSLSAMQLVRIAGGIVAGHPRDAVMMDSIARIAEVTRHEEASLLGLFYVPANREVAAQVLLEKRRN